MNKSMLWIALAAAVFGAAGGYWLAAERIGSTTSAKKPLFYRHPMNPSVTSTVPAKDEMGMDYVPVFDESAPDANPGQGKKVLHYRNPMGLPDTSPVPKKDAMGMDYIPVYEQEDQQGTNMLRVSSEKIQRLGVKTASAENIEIARLVRSVGVVEADERRLYNVTLRFDGFIEKLYVNTTGQAVARGQPLFELYSPDLVSAQQEYLSARNGEAALGNSEAWLQSGMKNLTDSSLERLRNWGISESELAHLRQQGKAQHALTVRSPASGIVMEKSVVAGARAMAGDTLFKIADLSQVWIITEVYEQDMGLIKSGQSAQVTLDAYPGQTFNGKVGFIYPMLNPATRTVKVRVELQNPDGLLKPMMYAQLEIASQTHTALAVPRSSVLESGRRTLVLVDLGEGRFEPRPVKLGQRGAARVPAPLPHSGHLWQSDDMVEIREGLSEHERVVVSANFLLDAESNLKAALSGFEPADAKVPAEPSQHGEHNHQGGM